MKRNIRILVPAIMLVLLFLVQAKSAEADWFNPTKDVSGALYGSQVWSSDVNLVGDVMVMGDLEMRNIQIIGNGYRIINSGKIIINGNVVLIDSSMSHVGGSMQFKSGSLIIRSSVQEVPSIPVVSEVTDSSSTVTGTAEANTWITVFIGKEILGFDKAYSDGSFSVAIPPQKAGTILLVTSMNSAFKESEAREVLVGGIRVLDAPQVFEVFDHSTSVTGIAEANTTIMVKKGTEIIGTTPVASDGTFTVLIPQQQTGTKLVITSTDGTGNVSEATEVTVTRVTPPETYNEWQPQQNVPKNKVWTIRFNTEIDELTITNKQIYILNQQQEVKKVNLLLGADKKSITVQPPIGGYEEGATYYMYIESGLKSAKGDPINMPVRFSYTIEK